MIGLLIPGRSRNIHDVVKPCYSINFKQIFRAMLHGKIRRFRLFGIEKTKPKKSGRNIMNIGHIENDLRLIMFIEKRIDPTVQFGFQNCAGIGGQVAGKTAEDRIFFFFKVQHRFLSSVVIVP